VDPKPPPTRSHLFTLRLWPEDVGDGRIEWRGQVKHVLTGETDYFRGWPALIAFLEQRLIAKTTSETVDP
jgi:hypothetical protein